MCDPVFEDCPVEPPTGPSMSDLPDQQAMHHKFTDQEVLFANLKILAATFFVVINFTLTPLIFNKNTVYTSSQTALVTLSGGSDWWATGNLILNYGGLAIFGTAFIMQSIATFGIIPDINFYVWLYGVYIGGASLTIVYLVFLLLAMEQSYGGIDGASAAAALQASRTIQREFGAFLGLMALFMSVFGWNQEAWLQGTEPAMMQEEEAHEQVTQMEEEQIDDSDILPDEAIDSLRKVPRGYRD